MARKVYNVFKNSQFSFLFKDSEGNERGTSDMFEMMTIKEDLESNGFVYDPDWKPT